MIYQENKQRLQQAKELMRQVSDDLFDAAHKNHTNYSEEQRDELGALLANVEKDAASSSMWWSKLERPSPASKFWCFNLGEAVSKVEEK